MCLPILFRPLVSHHFPSHLAIYLSNYLCVHTHTAHARHVTCQTVSGRSTGTPSFGRNSAECRQGMPNPDLSPLNNLV